VMSARARNECVCTSASKIWPFWANPWLLISHNHLRRALDQTLQPGFETVILRFKTQTLESTDEISPGPSYGKLKTYFFFTSTPSLFRQSTSYANCQWWVLFIDSKNCFAEGNSKKKTEFFT